ncbi:protein-tyrosine-phosphatase [Trichonephila inaurata madagascariensis]|uniref:Protein-tyrosine-phosphatase n=1 Tax=Trichonephila inaurata madagascariensis TaxID=2747483 RepID=A0A8X6XKL3_9ARAC|nr:protein-tyrosine-phosphatase [Trichonephila inaurata madagascariensis]
MNRSQKSFASKGLSASSALPGGDRKKWQQISIATKGENHSTRHATKEVNELKNSYKKMIPYDYNRVVMEAQSGVPDSDYINASFIDSIFGKPPTHLYEEKESRSFHRNCNDNCFLRLHSAIITHRSPINIRNASLILR